MSATGIRVEGLGKRFGARVAVERVSFEVRPGEVFGLLGPNGAGKTTTVRMLTGLLTPSEGEAFVFGRSVRDGGEALRRSIGLLTEHPGLYDRLSARENLEFFMRLNGVERAAGWARARRYLERFGLAGREDEPAGGFSKGMRQKLAIVRALVHEPEVIFLDEPTSGLDPESARTVRDAIAELAAEGRTLVLCSHNLPEVERLCERVVVIRRTVLAAGTLRELRRAGVALDLRLAGDAGAFAEAARRAPGVQDVLTEGAAMKIMLEHEGQAPEAIAALVQAGARLLSAVPTARPLEEVYLELVRSAA